MADYTTIDNPFKHFNTVLYSGTGSSNSVTGVGFQPDWTWIKNRNVTTYDHRAFDVVRGANKKIKPNTTEAETTTTQELSSFDSDGFTLGTENGVNASSTNYASWNWLGANGTTSNSDGSITSTISANPTAGFCICSWTGDGSDATIGHGLGAVPKMIIHKHRSGSVQWNVYHVGTGTGGYLRLDSTNAFASNSGFFGTAPTSSVFSPGSHSYMSGSGNDNIAYIFADVQGYSKFGKWTGTGQSSGPFIHTGFRPAFLSWKMTSSTENWYINDNKREPFNDDAMTVLYPNLNNADGALNDEIDLLSNGFKVRRNDNGSNTSGSTYIYMAFAENPFVTAGTKAAGTAR